MGPSTHHHHAPAHACDEHAPTFHGCSMYGPHLVMSDIKRWWARRHGDLLDILDGNIQARGQEATHISNVKAHTGQGPLPGDMTG